MTRARVSQPPAAVAAPPRCFAAVLTLFGTLLGVGGAPLLLLGGSPYYLIAGVVVIYSAILLWRGRHRGALLYGFFMGGTLIWSLWEVGLNGWALMPRLLVPALLGVWLLIIVARRRLS